MPDTDQKKTHHQSYASDMPTNERKPAITIDLWKAISIVAAAILTTFVATAFGAFRVLNTDHFVLAATVNDVAELKKNTVSKDIQVLLDKSVQDKFDATNAKLDGVALQVKDSNKKIDEVYNVLLKWEIAK